MTSRSRNSRSLYGALLLAALIGVAALIFMLDELVEVSRGRANVIAVFADAGRMRRGTPVRIAGRPTGRVKRIELLPRGADTTARLVVTLEIDRRDVHQIRASSGVRLTSDGLLGGPAVIDILPGPAENPPIARNDTLYARRPGSLDSVRVRAAKLKVSIDSLTVAAGTLADPTARLAERFDHLQDGVASVRAELAVLGTAFRQAGAGRLLDDATFLAALDRLTARIRDVSSAVADARARHADAPTEIAEEIARIHSRADALSERADSLLALLDGPGALTRLRGDSAISVAIRGFQAQLDSLIAEVRRRPLRFVF